VTIIYFLRHGVAYEATEWKTTGNSDEQRPLTDDGMAAMEREVMRMKAMKLAFTTIITSPLTRARQTAEIVHRQYAEVPFDEDALLKPGFDHKALEKLRRRYHAQDKILLVGHEPDFSEVISQLIGGGRIMMKKGGLACVRLTDDSKGELKWLLTPHLLGSDGE
jgi:phosphohistidine phosphatase